MGRLGQKLAKASAASATESGGTAKDILERAQRLADANEHGAILEVFDEAFGGEIPEEDPEQVALYARMLSMRARARHVLGQWSEAEDDARGVLALATRLKERTTLVRALQTLGELQKDRGEVAEALESHSNAARLAEALGDSLGSAQANLALSALHSKTGDLNEAEAKLDIVFGLLESMPNTPQVRRLRAAATVQKGIERFRKGGLPETVAFCTQALQMLEDDPLAVEAAEAYRFMGIAASTRLQHKEALQYLMRALAFYKRFGFRFGSATIYSSIGQSFLEMGRTDEAIHFMEKAKDQCLEMGALSEATTLYGKLGRAYLHKEEYDKATEYFRKDLILSQQTGGKRALAYIHRNLGQSLSQTGDLTEAITHFKESLQIFKQLRDEINTGKLYQDLCFTYIKQENYERARSLAPWAVNIFGKLQQEFEIAYMNSLMGMICRGEKNFTESEKYFKEALEFLQYQEPTARLVEALYDYGVLQVDVGRKQRAMECFARALRVAQRLGLKQQAHRCYVAIEGVDEIYLIQSLLQGV